MILGTGRFLAKPAAVIARESEFREFPGQNKISKARNLRQVIAKCHAIVVSAHDEAKYPWFRRFLRERKTPFFPAIGDDAALTESVFPNAVVTGRFRLDDYRSRSELRAILEFQAKLRIGHHRFPVHLHSVMQTIRVRDDDRQFAIRRRETLFGGDGLGNRENGGRQSEEEKAFTGSFH